MVQEVDIHPEIIIGEWAKGFALDRHIVSSIYLGEDEYGHPRFDSKRSDLGELLYKLKYQSDRSALPIIVKTASKFIAEKRLPIDLIVSVPPSKIRGSFQPVLEIVKGIASMLHVSLCTDCLIKIKDTQELKNAFDFDERIKLLKDAFDVNEPKLNGKKVLLFDDLYQSGATINTIAKILYKKGKVGGVYVVALTLSKYKT